MTDTKTIVRRFYELWNTGNLAALPEVLSDNATFRGSFDLATQGIPAFEEYAGMMAEAFPDVHITLENIIAEADRVAVQLTFTGTHQGQLFGVPATGRRITYSSAAFFTLNGGKIVECHMLGDVVAMLDQLLLESAQDADDADDDEDYDDDEAAEA